MTTVVVGSQTFEELAAKAGREVRYLTIDGVAYPAIAIIDGRKIDAERWGQALEEERQLGHAPT